MRRTLRQAWELDDADKAEKLIRTLARRLEREAPGVSASILEGLNEIPTVTRLRLPIQLRRSLACTNIIENTNGSIRRICRNVKRWRDAAMALRWTGAAMIEAPKGFRRLGSQAVAEPARRTSVTGSKEQQAISHGCAFQAIFWTPAWERHRGRSWWVGRSKPALSGLRSQAVKPLPP